jgi:hypothetical protein
MNLYLALVIFHVIGTAIGAGGATFSDWIFFNAAKDGKIDRSELNILKAASTLVSIGLAILIITGFGFLIHYLLVPGSGVAAPKAYAKIFIVAVIVVNGWVLHRRVLPLVEEASKENHTIVGSVIEKNRSLVLTAGAISIVSWYSALILGAWRGLEVSTELILIVYIGLVLVAVVAARTLGRLGLRYLHK